MSEPKMIKLDDVELKFVQDQFQKWRAANQDASNNAAYMAGFLNGFECGVHVIEDSETQ